MDVTHRIVDYVAATRPVDLPDTVHREARRSLFNIIGCMFGGARHDAVERADRALTPFAGPPHATLFGRGRKTDLLHAALSNCLASSIYSFDDTHEQAVVHPSGPVAAAALALVERRPTAGPDFLTAFALGVEFACRLCKAVSVPPATGNFGWSGTGISGGIGAAIAAGRLLQLDPARMHHAIGIALSQASGFRAMHGTMSMSLMPAQTAQTGLRAALMAAEGFTSSAAPLEGRHGYFSVFAEQPDVDALVDGMGERFELLRNTYKPYPCGIVIHPIIDACLELHRAHAPDPTRIAHVAIQASPGAMALCNRPHPRDEIQAQVSLHHWTAVALLRGTARIRDMDTATAVRDPVLMTFQDKVEATLDASIAADAAVVTLSMIDGAQHVVRVEHGIGSASRPMSDAELEAKFIGQAEPVIGRSRVDVLVQKSWGVESLADVGDLARAAA